MEDKRHPEDYCHNCGADNICWYAPNEIFNSVTGTHGEGIICPQCFMKMADAKGMKIIFTVEDFNKRGTAKDQELSLLTEKYNKLKEAFEAQVAYTELLGDEISDMSTICKVHHWQSSRIEEGQSLGDKLAELKVKAGLKEQ